MARVTLKHVRRTDDETGREHKMLAVEGRDEWLMHTTWPKSAGRKPLYKSTGDRATARAWLRCLDWAIENKRAELVSELAPACTALRSGS